MNLIAAILTALAVGLVTQVTLAAAGVPTDIAHTASLPAAAIAAALASATVSKIRNNRTERS